jgi:L-iditol 2-dehydrogenase
MKAVRYHGPKDCRIDDVDVPAVGDKDVLVRIRAAGVCASDVHIYDGTDEYITSGRTRVPFVPGHEWSGEVVAVGADVHEFAPGDTVSGECGVGCGACRYCLDGHYNICENLTETGFLNRDGSFAEYIAHPRHVVHKCSRMTFDAAACIEPTTVALYATKLAAVCPADYVVVLGPGPIGLFAVQTAKAYGARKVILVGTRDSRLDVGRTLGADATVNIRREDLAQRVREETDGRMADVVIEAVGKPAVWDDIAAIVARRARVAMTGLFEGAKSTIGFDKVVLDMITILGCVGGPGCWGEAIDLHERSKVTARPMITHHLPLTDFAKAIEITRNRTDDAIKVILEP